MKKMNKKGFTIVELVIVIAVIAILAAVLIPTFSGVVSKANQSAAMQAARNEYTEYMTTLDSKIGTGNYVIEAKQGNNTFYFAVKDGQFNSTAYTNEDEAKAAAGITTALVKTDLSVYDVYTIATVNTSSDLNAVAYEAKSISNASAKGLYEKTTENDTDKYTEITTEDAKTGTYYEAYQTFKEAKYYTLDDGEYTAVTAGTTKYNSNTKYYTKSTADYGSSSVKIYK